MSTPLHDLQRLIASRRAISGRVVAITGNMVRVATAHGVMEAPGDGGLQIGDRVMVRNGKAVLVQKQQDASVHYV